MKQVNANLSYMQHFQLFMGEKKKQTVFPRALIPFWKQLAMAANEYLSCKTLSPWEAGRMAKLNRVNLKSNAYKPTMSPGNG